MADYEMVAGNTADPLTETLYSNGTVVDVSAGTLTVYFRNVTGSAVLTYTGAGLTGTSAGVLTLDWGGTIGDAPPTKGKYVYQIKHDNGAGDITYWPTDYNGKPSYKTATIHEALG